MFPLSGTGWQRRACLYGLLIALAGGLALATWWARRAERAGLEAAWMNHDWEAEPAVQLLRDYVRIDTSRDTGDERPGAAWLAARLREAGVEPVIENLGERNANLWAILEGEDPEALVLHHHLDVSGGGDLAAWRHPPFEAVYDPPWVFGRGVFDMKSIGIAQLLAFLDAVEAARTSGRPPARSLVFLATGDEETGSHLGTEWVLREHPELAARFAAVFTEGGVVEAITPQEVKYWGVEVAQKRFAEGAFCSADRQRLEDLREDLIAHSLHPLAPLTVDPALEEILPVYGATRENPLYARALADPAATARDLSTFRRLPGYLQSMFRAEVVPSEVEEDPQGGYRLSFLIHLPLGRELADALPELLPPWMTAGLAAPVTMTRAAAHGSPLDTAAYRELVAGIEAAQPGTAVGPWLLPWSATDSRYFRAAGIPSYGYSPFLILTTDTYNVDAPNERMAMPGYVSGVEQYRAVVARIIGSSPPAAP